MSVEAGFRRSRRDRSGTGRPLRSSPALRHAQDRRAQTPQCRAASTWSYGGSAPIWLSTAALIFILSMSRLGRLRHSEAESGLASRSIQPESGAVGSTLEITETKPRPPSLVASSANAFWFAATISFQAASFALPHRFGELARFFRQWLASSPRPSCTRRVPARSACSRRS